MNSFKRMFITLKSQIDTVADEFENHEALAGAAIKDLEVIGSKTRIHLHRVKGMVDQQEQKLADLKKEAELWSERAVKVRDTDEQRALECVKRLRSVRTQIEQLEKQLQETEKLEAKVQTDLNKIQDELQQVKQKKELLSARQNRTQVKAVMEDSTCNPRDEVQDIFQRWENTVIGSEFQYPEIPDDEDPFSSVFEKEEDDVELKAMLDELTEQNGPETPEKTNPEKDNV